MLKYKKTTYNELASYFEVSTKTIERDIDRLSTTGIPVYCQQGSGGGVYIDENYKFNQSFFTVEDIGHMITALHIAKTFTANPQNKEVFKKLTLLNPDLTTFFNENIQKHLFLDLYDQPVDFEHGIFAMINHCLDFKVYATINDVFEVVPLSYVYKVDGIHLFCYKDDYKLLKIAEIKSFIPSEVEVQGEYISYEQCQNKFKNIF